MNLRLLITGTDTGVGKTRVTCLLAQGLRDLGRSVWLHKPVVSGRNPDGSFDDVVALQQQAAADQPVASVAPCTVPEPASPHLAARLAGVPLDMQRYRQALAAVDGDHDLLVEGVGGVLVPITDALETIIDFAKPAALRPLVVARPHLGTLNHSALTVAALRQAGLEPLGLVVNHHEQISPSVATTTAAEELTRITGLPVLAEIPYQPDATVAIALATAVYARSKAPTCS